MDIAPKKEQLECIEDALDIIFKECRKCSEIGEQYPGVYWRVYMDESGIAKFHCTKSEVGGASHDYTIPVNFRIDSVGIEILEKTLQNYANENKIFSHWKYSPWHLVQLYAAFMKDGGDYQIRFSIPPPVEWGRTQNINFVIRNRKVADEVLRYT